MQRDPILIGTSLKMYFGYQQTLDWCQSVADLARRHPAIQQGHAELFVLPAFPTLPPVLDIFAGTGTLIGGQDVCDTREGARTGEVSAAMLAEMGCRLAEVGHAERRRFYQEDDAMVASKTATAIDAGLTPVLCVGEREQGPVEAAIDDCIDQIDTSLEGVRGTGPLSLIVAYEPHWAIGASQPASVEHIAAVCRRLQAHLDARRGGAVIYGGSAGPGLLTELAGSTRGMFLGRFVHDPQAFERIFDEVVTLASKT